MIPPSLTTMLGSAVPTIVVSREASAIPSMSAMVTMILAFLVTGLFAYLMLDMWIKNRTINKTQHEE